MPKFITITPTGEQGQKGPAWERFRDGHYVAIGWLNDTDLTGKSLQEITKLVHDDEQPEHEEQAVKQLGRFIFEVKPGDYVGVNNVSDGLFGVGVIESDYKFQIRKHDPGDADPDNPGDFYPHYRDVKWITTEYMRRTSLVREGEPNWTPFRAVGKVFEELPAYIARLVGTAPSTGALETETARPAELKLVIEAIEALRREREHRERAHESLVEDFFVALGYAKHKDIKYQQGRVDVRVASGGRTLLIAEVKAAWGLSFDNGIEAIEQAYRYAHEEGVRHVIVTNGDSYIVFDRLKGLSWETNLLGEFQLTKLHREDLALIDRLRHARLSVPDVGEALRHVAESFA